MAFLISFFVIGLYWSVHVRLFREIIRYDMNLIWLNLLHLLFIVIIPFSTSIISLYLTQLSVIVYAACMACAGYIHTLLRIYAGHKHRLISDKYSSSHIKKNLILSLIAPICFTDFNRHHIIQFVSSSIIMDHDIVNSRYLATGVETQRRSFIVVHRGDSNVTMA